MKSDFENVHTSNESSSLIWVDLPWDMLHYWLKILSCSNINWHRVTWKITSFCLESTNLNTWKINQFLNSRFRIFNLWIHKGLPKSTTKKRSSHKEEYKILQEISHSQVIIEPLYRPKRRWGTLKNRIIKIS